jgi:LmbE family N-acetylglucosaminyl deacetylase
MLIAPHPDDESLASSIVLQRAVSAGATIRVIYATDGDDNPWPQRLLERKLRLKHTDRTRWGKLRRSEALGSLGVLGIKPRDAKFLGLPDQGLTNLLRNDCQSTIDRFAELVGSWAPTHLLVPSISDTHPDHNALGVMMRLVLESFDWDIDALSYVVHGKSAAFSSRAEPLLQSQEEADKKLNAILCHKSQIKLSRKRFLGYASRPERFLRLQPSETIYADGPVRAVVRTNDVLNVTIRLSPRLVRSGEVALFLLGRNADGVVQCLKSRLPVRSGRIIMRESGSGRRVIAEFRGNVFAGEFTIPLGSFSVGHALFIKLERRSLFFDEAGWLEIAPTIRKNEIGRVLALNEMIAAR